MKDKDKTIDYRKYIDNLLTFNGLLDLDGKVLMANRTVVEGAGLSYDDVIGKYFPDTYWWSYDSAVQKRIANAIDRAKKGEAVISEEKVRLANSIVDVQFSLRPIFDEKGKVEYLMAEGQDITRIKAAEKELRKSHELINAISNFTGMVDIDGKLQLVNKKAINYLGFAEEDMLGIPFWEGGWFVPSRKTVNVMRNSIDAALQGKTTRVETNVFTKGGREISVFHTSAPMFDESGNIIGVAVEGVNISELKEKEEALQKSETMYRDLATYMNEGLGITDEMGNYNFVNPKLCEMMEYSKEEFLDMNVKDLFDKKNRQLLLKEAKKRAKGKSSQYEITFTTKSGKNLPAFVSASPIFDNGGEYKGTRGAVTDLTPLKEIEAKLLQAQKMEAVGILAGGIAHDFNNILQAIFGYTQILMLKKKPGDPDLHKLKTIEESAQKASDLVKRILLFGQKVESHLRPVNLNREVKTITEILSRSIPKMIDIELHLAEDLKTVNADPVQIEQIMMNLGVNAADAMPDGGKLIFETANVILDERYINSHLGSRPGEYVLLTISDTGSGIDQETLKHIFEPFFTTKEAGRGTGLGLAMVYGIVKSHNGYITCYSEPGQETTFKIYLPVIDTMPEEPTLRIIEKKGLPRGSETILLVDDEEALRDLGQETLKRQGFSAILAESGERALEIYKERKDSIDLVVLDVGMPGIGGHGCFQELKKIDPKVKVIIATGYSANGRVKETIEAGAAGFIGKPYRLADMLNKIREVLDEK